MERVLPAAGVPALFLTAWILGFSACFPLLPLKAAAAFESGGAGMALPARPGCAQALMEHDGVKKNGQLRVEGRWLVNAGGKAVQLRGMSTHGLHWYPQYSGKEAIRYLKNLGANLFRVAMVVNSKAPGSYSESQEARGLNLYLLHLAVENSLSEDMYTIIDWHLLEDGNPLKLLDGAKSFFSDISQRYAGDPGVIYEICNEPNGDATWEDISRYAREIIPLIRKNSPHAVIIVGTPEHSGAVDSVRDAPLPFDNVMYAYHLYPRDGETSYHTGMLEKMLAENYPIFVSEWGVNTNRDDGGLALEAAGEFVEFMRQHMLSWANWSLCNKDEPYSAIASDVGKLSDWTEEDLSPSGRLVFKALRGR